MKSVPNQARSPVEEAGLRLKIQRMGKRTAEAHLEGLEKVLGASRKEKAKADCP
jgi:hypothetical protein